MSNIIIRKSHLQALLAAAHNIQALLDDSTLTAAWGEGKPDDINAAVSAFDNLANRARIVQDETGMEASPFLRYRNEIMAETPAGAYLRRLVLSLYCGHPLTLRPMIERFGVHEIRVMLECLVSFTTHGDRDSQFMGLAMEITESAITQSSEVAA